MGKKSRERMTELSEQERIDRAKRTVLEIEKEEHIKNVALAKEIIRNFKPAILGTSGSSLPSESFTMVSEDAEVPVRNDNGQTSKDRKQDT